MRGVDASRAIVASGAATNSRMSRIRSQKPSLWSSPAHPWRAPVQQTQKSHRSGSAGRKLPVALSCLVLSQAASCRLRLSSHVPVIGCFPLVRLERRARSVPHAGLKTERGVWRLIATTNAIDVTPVLGVCQVRDVRDVRFAMFAM